MATYSFDVDGVIAEFSHYAIHKLGPCDESLYSLEERWPDKLEQVHRLVSNPYAYLDLELIPGAKQGLIELHKAGIKIHICTARPIPESFTARWLLEHKIPFDWLDTVDVGMSKFEFIRMRGSVGILEDSPFQIYSLLGKARVLIYDQLWNRNIVDGLTGNGRVYNWEQVVETVMGLAKG